MVRTAGVLFFCAAACAACASDFYVSPTGGDGNDGVRERPFATLDAARDAARKAGAGPHRIELLPGEHFLSKPFDLDGRDSGLTVEAVTINDAHEYRIRKGQTVLLQSDQGYGQTGIALRDGLIKATDPLWIF